jgi:hypothetical protein
LFILQILFQFHFISICNCMDTAKA